jgi:hypothetical protein
MAKTDATLVTTVTLNEATDMVQHVGADVSFIFQGEMGIGKSYMLDTLTERMPTHVPVYAELPTFDVSDVSGVPWLEAHGDVKITRFAPNALLNIHGGKPVIFMADEIGKASRPVQNSILRLLNERKVGEYALPKGSIVFGTTNLTAEGLGDTVQAHAYNRCSFVTVRKPTAEEWIQNYAMANNVHPVIIAWVKRNPICMNSYMEDDGNPYIYYPGKTAKSFVTPRSLTKASHIMWQKDKLGDNATYAGIAGCVGDAAARDIMVFSQTFDRMPSWSAIVTTPDTCTVPADGDFAALFSLVFNAINMVTKDTFGGWMTYCQRLPKTYQGVFALNVLTSPKRDVALNNRAFCVWAAKNHWMV